MTSRIVLLLLVALGGVGLALQMAWNARLRVATGSAVLATLISVIVTLIVVALVWASGMTCRGSVPPIKSVPVWAWMGGICPAYYLVAALLGIPKFGTGTVFALVIAGQMITAVILDATGAFGVPQIPISIARVVGIVLLISGVIVIQKA